MEIFIIVAAILVAVVLGAYVISRMNHQHDERIAAFHYTRFLPGSAAGRPAAGPVKPSGESRDGRRDRSNQRRSRLTTTTGEHK